MYVSDAQRERSAFKRKRAIGPKLTATESRERDETRAWTERSALFKNNERGTKARPTPVRVLEIRPGSVAAGYKTGSLPLWNLPPNHRFPVIWN